MLKPNKNQVERMTESELVEFRKALQEEQAAKSANIDSARSAAKRLQAEADWAAHVVRQLREAREAAGVSLAELESRTGIRKSALSRLENSKAPNPTLSSLYRYAKAIGCDLTLLIEQNASSGDAGHNNRAEKHR